MTLLAVCQLALQVGDPEGNRAAAAGGLAEAANAGADIAIVPELTSSGYVFTGAAEAASLAEPADDSPTLKQWAAIAAEANMVVIGGFCERGEDGQTYNSAAVLDPTGVRTVYRKAHLWDKEAESFIPGDRPPPVVDTPHGRIGLVICYDLEFPEWIRLPALSGAQLLAAPANWPWIPRPEGERPAEVVKAQANAAINGMYVAVADRCGPERGVDWVGGSMIVGPDGYPLAGPVLADRPQVLLAEIDLARADDKRISDNNHVIADRRPELYAGLTPG